MSQSPTIFVNYTDGTKAVILDYQASMNQYLDYVTTNGYCHQVLEQRDTLGGGSKIPWSQHNQDNTALCKTPAKQHLE